MKIRITVGEIVFLVADQTRSVSNEGSYQCRLLNDVALNEQFDALATAPVTIALNLRNDDAFVGYDIDLWAADVLVTANNGRSWAGKVTAWDNDENSILNIEVTEKTAPELKFYFPDEINRIYSIDEKFHYSAVNATLPMAIGGNDANPLRVMGLLINTEEGIYGFCTGEIHKFTGIRVGGETLTVAEANNRGYATFTGSPSQENYPGMVYVQITDEELRKNDDGTYVELGAELVGLKFGTHTIEECRNGARALYWIMKTPAIGAGGWGLGIAESNIDLDAINAAISVVNAASLKMDGVFYFKQIAMSWIRQICLAIRGTYSIGSNGLRSLFVDAPASSIKTYTINNMRLLNHGKGAFTGRVYNTGKLDYGFNSVTAVFMQSAQYQNSESIEQIEDQEFYGQSYLINDAATAQAIVEYTCKRSLIAAYKVLFETDDLPSNVKKGSIITIDRLDKAITGLYQVSKLKITNHIHTVEAEKYDASCFEVGSSSTKIDWTEELPVVSVVNPGAASGLTLSSEVRPSREGTNLIVIKGTFTPPAGSYLAASIEYGKGILPILSWTDLGLMRGNSFVIPGVEPDQAYAVKIRMVTANGKSSYITNTLTTEGDSIPPGKPSISATSSLKNVSISLSLSSVPSDMAGFQIFRNTTNNSGTATQIGYVESSKGTAQTVDINTEYGSTYYYWAKAVDTWGNPSVFSDAFGPITISMILNVDLSPEAIRQAIGSIASWSAKNCTTASIAEASGVKDVSGNTNHGRAYGGATVVDTPMGRAFQFDGVNDYISAAFPPILTTQLNISFFVKWLSANYGRGIIGCFKLANTSGIAVYATAENLLRVNYGDLTNINVLTFEVPSLLSFNHFSVNADETAETISLFANGLLVETKAAPNLRMSNNVPITIGRGLSDYDGEYGNCLVFGSKAFSRVLTATEIKSLVMFPDDVAFGRVTADLIATGTLQALIAQIAEAFIGDANIINVNAGKLNAGFINAERYEGKSITVDKLKIGRGGAALNDDPNFEDSTAWVLTQATLVDLSDGKIGRSAMRTRAGGYGFVTSARFIPIDSNKPYRRKFTARSINGASGSTYIYDTVYDANYNVIGYNVQNFGAVLQNTWTDYIKTFKFPAAARFVKIVTDANNGTPGATVYVEIQDNRLEEAIGTTLIENGSVTTEKLTTDAVKSLNYSTEVGSFLNLADGKFIVGGSANPVFTVDAAAKTGKIAGFSFNTTDLTAGATTAAIGISTDTAKRAFWAGGTTSTTAPFNVTHAGAMTATKGFISKFEISSANLIAEYSVTGDSAYMRLEAPESGDLTPVLTLGRNITGNVAECVIHPAFLGSVLHAFDATVPASTMYGFYTTGRVYAAGGYYPTSDERAKSDINDISVLENLKSVRVKKYHLDDVKIKNLKREKEIERNLKEKNAAISETPSELEPEIENYNPCKSIGVMAQDFNKAFGIGHNESETYNLTDAIGVALRAIQELAEIVDDLKAENKELRAALNLPEKQERKKKEIERELSDVEKEVLHIVEKRARKAILKRLLEAEKQ